MHHFHRLRKRNNSPQVEEDDSLETRFEDDFVVVDSKPKPNGMVEGFVMVDPDEEDFGSTSLNPNSEEPGSGTAHNTPINSSHRINKGKGVQEPSSLGDFIIVDKPAKDNLSAGVRSTSTKPSVENIAAPATTATSGEDPNLLNTAASISSKILDLCMLLLDFRREFASQIETLRAEARNLSEGQAGRLDASVAHLEKERDAAEESSEAAMKELRHEFEPYCFVEKDEAPTSASENPKPFFSNDSDNEVPEKPAENIRLSQDASSRDASSRLFPTTEGSHARRLSEYQSYHSGRRPSWGIDDELHEFFASSQESEAGMGPTRDVVIDWYRYHQDHCRPGEELVNCRTCTGWMTGLDVSPRI